MSTSVPPRRSPARKLAFVVALAVFTTGVSGYFMGRLQTDRSVALRASQISNLKSEISVAPSGAAEAPRYADLRDRTRQINHNWHSNVATLPAPPVFVDGTPAPSADELAALRLRRDSRRAYVGAPPVVPHPIDQQQSTSCLACHGQPTRIGTLSVPQISHPRYTNCIQCHAPKQGPGPDLATPPPALATPVLANTFDGLPPPAGGTRAYAGAPPTLPHTTAMRQNCVSCHGPGGSSAIKTPHPQRQNCVQCHALDATRETLPPAIR
ncbi:MAG: hypothetical protein WC661_15330 [Opitutaceae bacterium]|jgi:cytochrome c-type protein NapB